MITSNANTPLIFAADNGGDNGGGDSGGGSKDNGGGKEDNQKSNDGGGDKQSNSQQKDEGGTQQENRPQKQKEESNQQDNIKSEDTKVTDRVPFGEESKQINHDKLKGTPQEQEQAARDDYIHDDPGKIRPYPDQQPHPIHKGAPRNIHCNDGGCGTGEVKHKGGDGWNGRDGDKGDWCKHHDCRDSGHHSHGDHNHHHNHDHNYHNDRHHYDNHDHNYYYYYNNDYSNNHATVILQLDYSHSNSYHDVNIEIGNDFDANFDLAGQPENLVITGLDLDNGENFDVCIENDGDVNCEQGHINNQDDVDYVDIRIP